ncbi:hypothetical protein V5O48_010120 [Marasmius crinis-equi]|uniref:Uncharacterized protein n=1 Tax=Marasmius crinis-equi TaxID=585013 RepID=A0ABR3F9C1_9AGAR
MLSLYKNIIFAFALATILVSQGMGAPTAQTQTDPGQDHSGGLAFDRWKALNDKHSRANGNFGEKRMSWLTRSDEPEPDFSWGIANRSQDGTSTSDQVDIEHVRERETDNSDWAGGYTGF